MPIIVLLLSLLGLAPLIVFACGAVGTVPEMAIRMLIALIDYAALILAFVGGVHWGLALQPAAVRPARRFAAGVLPMIIAWVALVLAQVVEPSVALTVLVVGYIATVVIEQRASQKLPVPSRYMLTRWSFSMVAVVMMVMVVVLRGIGQTIVF